MGSRSSSEFRIIQKCQKYIECKSKSWMSALRFCNGKIRMVRLTSQNVCLNWLTPMYIWIWWKCRVSRLDLMNCRIRFAINYFSPRLCRCYRKMPKKKIANSVKKDCIFCIIYSEVHLIYSTVDCCVVSCRMCPAEQSDCRFWSIVRGNW